jgi:hydrogenase-4 component E
MNIQSLDPLLVLVLLMNLYILTSTQLRAVVRAVAVQGVLLAAAYPIAHLGGGLTGHEAAGVDAWAVLRLVALTLVMAGVKGFILPWLLLKALRQADIRRQVESTIGIVPALLVGAVGTVLAMVFANRLPLRPDHTSNLVVPASLATVFTGFLILTTRWRAITQVLGYIVLENGIFIFGLLLIDAIPILVELGVLLDLFVGVFVMGIIINHVSRAFGEASPAHLKTLRD